MLKHWDEDGDPWVVKGTSEVHRNAFFAVELNEVVRPDGSQGRYQIVRMRKLGAGILAVESDGSAYVVGQWRLPLARYSWELPMGGVEAGEAPLEAAKRELREESGIEATHWTQLLDLDLSTSVTDERCVAFLAMDLTHRSARPEPREVIRRRGAPFMELVARAEQGLIKEAVSVAAIFRAHRMASAGNLPTTLAQAMLTPF